MLQYKWTAVHHHVHIGSLHPPSIQLTSQHPYAETMIGSPHVRTIDIGDLKKVDKVLEEILKEPVIHLSCTI